MQVKDHDSSYDYYDVAITNSMREVITKHAKAFQYNRWQVEATGYAQAENSFLSDLPYLKIKFLDIIDAYLLENKDPNQNSRKLLGQTFIHIQSIQDIATGRAAYHTMRYIASDHSSDSPKLCKHIQIMVDQLDYYFQPSIGICEKYHPWYYAPKVIEELEKNAARSKAMGFELLDLRIDVTEKQEALIKTDVHTWVNQCIEKKYNTILAEKQLITAAQTYDAILLLIEQFKATKVEYESSIYVRLSKEAYHDDWGDAYPLTSEQLDQRVQHHCYYEIDVNPWNPESEESLQKKAEVYQLQAYEDYQIRQQNMDNAKRKVLQAIEQILHPKMVHESQGFHMTNDVEIDQALCASRQQLLQNVAQEYAPFFATERKEICKRLAILLGKTVYTAFIHELCQQIYIKFGVAQTKEIPIAQVTQNNTSSLKVEDQSTALTSEKYMLFKPFKNQPGQFVPASTLEEGGAIDFLYCSSGL